MISRFARNLLPAAAFALLCGGPAIAGVLGPRAAPEAGQTSPLIRVQAADPAALARFEVRLGRLEEELRRLTGRMEEVEFAQRRFDQRLEKLIADLDARLAALEGGDRSGGGDEAAGQAGQGTRDATPPELASSDDPPVVDAPTAPEGSLGTVSDRDVAALPRPDPAAATAPERGDLTPSEQYRSALGLLRSGDYAGAANGLDLFLEVNPDDPLAPNAAYWLGESHYVREDYASAASTFARNYGDYGSDAPKAADNLLKLGMSLHQLGRDDEACRAYSELDTTFPDAPAHIRQALQREREDASCGA